MSETPANYEIREYTAGDGYKWRYRCFAAPGPIRSRVVFLHGIQSHGGWYEYSCDLIRHAGYEVFFLDRRGSGLNQEARGDSPSFRRLLDDIAEFLGPLRSELGPASEPGAERKAPRVFLGAISWGGKLAVALQRRHPGLVDGLMLLCPGLFPRVRPAMGERIRMIWSSILRPRRYFNIPLGDPELFTSTPRWQEFIAKDPLAIHQATARFLMHSARLDAYLRLVPKYVREPVLLLLAEKDRIIVNARTRSYVESFRTDDKEIIEYTGAGHTLEFEEDPSRHVADIIRWLNRQVEKP